MKQFITLVATAVIAAATFQVHADGDNKMVIVTDGSSTPVSVADITKITFDGMTMTVSTPDGDAQTDLTQVKHIVFDLSALSTDNITKDFEDGVTITANCGVVTASTLADTQLSAKVYTLSGALVASATGQSSVSIDLNNLPKGVYIVSAGGKTIKFTR